MKDFLGVKIHEKDPEFVNDFSKTLLENYYSKEETIPMALARPAIAFCGGDLELAQRIYDYAYKNYFMYASPVLSNAPKGEWKENEFEFHSKISGMPISCFALTVEDSIKGQTDAQREVALLSVAGGGVGLHNQIRGVSEKAPGPIPYWKVMDSIIGYYRQGSTRRGALAMYMDIDHPDIIEHIDFKVPGGDPKRRSDNRTQVHNAVNITDEFIGLVKDNGNVKLKCPHTDRVYDELPARGLLEKIIETRALTGEPYMWKIDLANRMLPKTQRDKGLRNKGSNLCSEIALATDEFRTFVCCLSSLNLEKYLEWKDTTVVADLVRLLDNVISYFIKHAPEDLVKAKYSAEMERAIGIGTFGWHSFLQSKNIPMESGGMNSAVQWTNIIFKDIKEKAVAESQKLAIERGEPDDMIGSGMRNSHLLAIAPNANSSDLANTSPSREPWYRNVFIKDTRAGSFKIKNKYLEKVLEVYSKNTDEVWKDIDENNGSVQHLDFLTEHEKKVFKTAIEMDQHWLVELADQAGKYVCQAQSLNLFFPSGADRQYVLSVHLKFLFSEYVKSLYYYRTEKKISADTVKGIERKALGDWMGEECVACSG